MLPPKLLMVGKDGGDTEVRRRDERHGRRRRHLHDRVDRREHGDLDVRPVLRVGRDDDVLPPHSVFMLVTHVGQLDRRQQTAEHAENLADDPSETAHNPRSSPQSI